MKKNYLILLACAGLLGTSTVMADEPSYSLTEDWKALKEDPTGAVEGLDRNFNWNAENVSTKPCVRFATAMDGKIYFVNMQTMSIAEFTQDGEIKDLYKLPALSGDDYYGTSLTHDDAGHFLVGHYFTSQKSSYIWTIYDPKTGEYQHIDATPETLPSNGRIDCVGRVIGDLTDRAYLHVSSTAYNSSSTPIDPDEVKIFSITFVNGGETINDVEAYGEFSPTLYLAAHNTSIAQPRYSNIDDMIAYLDNGGKLCDTFYSYSAKYGSANTTADYWPMFYCFDNGNLASLGAQKFASYAGGSAFDTFELNGHRYFVINYVPLAAADASDLSKGTMDVAVYDDELNLLATWSNPNWMATTAYTSIVAEPVDDTTANIYSYACTGNFNGQSYGNAAIGGAKLTFKAEGVSGIADIAIDEASDAPAVYYNLQGVEVANPENGIFIVKRGNKVSKEVIR